MRSSKLRILPVVCGLVILLFASLTVRSQAFGGGESILWNFGDGVASSTLPVAGGVSPDTALLRDAKGNLYGTTYEGGLGTGLYDYGVGTVFELTPPATSGGSWSQSTLWTFADPSALGPDGFYPNGGLVMDSSGHLYGTTQVGGGGYSWGTVFELTPPATSGGSWTESVIWRFGSAVDGAAPYAGIIIDKSGNLYGTTYYGGTHAGVGVGGTVFKLTPTGAGTWNESILWNFGGTDGSFPYAGVIMDTAGNLYGTTAFGGAHNVGTAFKLTPGSGGSWTESVLWSFGASGDGSYPAASLVMDASGNLYGTTASGGFFSGCLNPFAVGDGTVFKLTPGSAASWTESVLWNFGNGSDGCVPDGGLILDPGGNLYGTTSTGGTYGSPSGAGGTVFKLTPGSGASWTESVLWNFGNGADGFNPDASLIADTIGNLYGTTVAGGAEQGTNGGGTVFELFNIAGSPTPSATPSTTPTASPSPTPTTMATATPTPAVTSTPAPTPTPTPTPAAAPTLPPAPTPTVTPTPNGAQILQRSNVNFPATSLGNTSTAPLLVRNIGKGQLIGTVLPPPAPFGLSGSGSFSLAPKASTTFTLSFTPVSTARSRQVGTIVSNSKHHSTALFVLHGRGK